MVFHYDLVYLVGVRLDVDRGKKYTWKGNSYKLQGYSDCQDMEILQFDKTVYILQVSDTHIQD